MPFPTIIFVPGAWHPPTCFAQVLRPLTSAGYPTTLVPLPTINPQTPHADWSADVAAIRTAITAAADAGQHILLVVHSYGGLPGSEAARDLDVATRARKNLPGGVVRLLYVCAFMVPRGASLLEAVGGADLDWWDVAADRRTLVPRDPGRVFYNDLPEGGEGVRAAVAALRPQSYGAFVTRVTYEAWRDVPTTYVYCLRDNAIDIEVQRGLVEGVAAGVDIATETLDAGHSPFYSVPGELVAVIRRAAGEI
ncbi:Alpha/beta hydrolase fold-1 [Aspergillus heterothallicus]